jgi:aminoglycoside 6'-N-acetyltransferase I
MDLIPFDSLGATGHAQAAALLVEAMAHAPSAWRDLRQASAEVETFLANDERLAIAAIEDGAVQGWIGAIRHSPQAWELHPLAVRPDRQGHGIGSRLVRALEERARGEGVLTIWLGTDDDFGGTNLFGAELYPDVLSRLQTLAPAGRHPFVFYRKLGYAVVGVLPDASGFGMPDILMAKRIG